MNSLYRHWTRKLLIVPGLGVLMGCNQPGPEFQKAAADLPKIKAEIQSAGISLDLKDLQPKIRPEEDAYPLLKAAFGGDLDFSKVKQQIGTTRKLDDEAWLKKVEEQLPTVNLYLDQVVNASRRPKINFLWKDSKDDSWGNLPPELAEVKTLAEWLGYRAIIAAKNSKGGQSMADLRAAFTLGDFILQTPLSIQYLVAVALETISAAAAAYAANWSGYEPEFCSDLLALLQERTLSPNPTAAVFRGEIANVSSWLWDPRNPEEMKEMDQSGGFIPDWAKDPVMVDALHARILGSYFSAIKIIESGKQPLEISTDLKDETKRQQALEKPKEGELWWDSLDSSQFWSAWLRRQAALILQSASIELSAEWARSGVSPKDLKILGNRYIDPFTSKPIQLAQRDGKLFVYSVGQDQKDILVPILAPKPQPLTPNP